MRSRDAFVLARPWLVDDFRSEAVASRARLRAACKADVELRAVSVPGRLPRSAALLRRSASWRVIDSAARPLRRSAEDGVLPGRLRLLLAAERRALLAADRAAAMDAARRDTLRDAAAPRVLAGGRISWRAEALAREALCEAVPRDRAAARAALGCVVRCAELPRPERTDGGPLLDLVPSAKLGRLARKADEPLLARVREGGASDRLPRLMADRLPGGGDELRRSGEVRAAPPPLGRVKVRGAER